MCCRKNYLYTVLGSVIMTGLIIFKTWFIIIWNIGMILYEIPDKYVDIATAVEYHKGRLFHKPKESVYRALLAFTVIGCFISVTKISLCVWRIYLKYTGNESYEKRYHVLSLGAHSVKVILEAFPQSIIAKFYFVHCPIKKYGWGVRFLDPAFDTFCGFPFIFFLVYLCYYGCITCKCCDKRDEYSRREWLKNLYTCCTCFGSVLFITFALSVMGLVFTSLSLSEFSKRCS